MPTAYDHEPLLLYEAVVSLYPSDRSGSALTGGAIWLGALANHLRLADHLKGLEIGTSGDRYKTVVHVDESHGITIERTWAVQWTGPSVFRPARNQQYVMIIQWVTDGIWFQRIYYGVTGISMALASNGVLESNQTQEFRAQSVAEIGGPVTSGGGFTPTLPTGEYQALPFFHEQPLMTGSYLIGQYVMAAAGTVLSANAIALAGQGTDTVLTLEVNGSLTATTLTLAQGTANTEVRASATLNIKLNAGDSVRWKVTSGPGLPENAAWQAALVTQVQQA